MDQKIKTFADLIADWGIAAFAGGIGVKYSTANAMRQRNSVPAEYFPAILRAASDTGKRLTADDLVQMTEKSVAARAAKAEQAA